MQNATNLTDVYKKRREKIALRQGYLGLFVRILAVAAIVYVMLSQVFLITQADGNGMFPSLKDGDLIIAFRLQSEYAKDDVVVYTAEGETRIGRIVASATDTVMLDDSGTLLVNGTAQSGEIMYPTYAGEELSYPYIVPEGCVFILGDYRTQTQDSRDFGAVELRNVKGKVITLLRRRGI